MITFLYSIIGELLIALCIFLFILLKQKSIVNKIRKKLSLNAKTTQNILKELEKKYYNCSHKFLETESLYDDLYYFINNLPFGVMTIDIFNHRILSMNKTLRELLKIRSDNAIGKKYYLVFENYRFLSSIEKAMERFKKNKEKTFEEDFLIDDPQYRYVKINYIFPNRITNEILVIITDITLQREVEEKSAKLISDVAHELRTPLTSIHGFAETLLESNISEEDQKKFLKIIESESARLGRLINEILDIVRMDSKKTKMSLSSINLSEIVQYIVELVQEDAMSKNIKIIKEIEPNIKIMGNEDKIVQAFLNIVDNAIKYTAGIGNKVEIRLRKDNTHAIFEVKDNGPGIPSVYLDKIFERFFRVDKSRTHNKVGGSGLGLSIVKSIIEYHNGLIEAESEVGKGATFIIILPLLHGNVS